MKLIKPEISFLGTVLKPTGFIGRIGNFSYFSQTSVTKIRDNCNRRAASLKRVFTYVLQAP